MFRKTINISLVIVFLISTTGITLSKHYCHNRLVKISVNTEAKSCCEDGMGKCCRNDTLQFQVKEDFLYLMSEIQFENRDVIDLFILTNILFNQNTYQFAEKAYVLVAESPPPEIIVPLSKLQTYLL